MTDTSEKIKMEIIQCFRSEIEKNREEQKSIYAEQQVIKERLRKIDTQEENQSLLIAKIAGLERDKINIEGRISKHSKESKENYNKLEESFNGLKNDFSHFRGDVFKKLDTMSGRDSVLKIIFGAFAGGIIAYVVKVWFT